MDGSDISEYSESSEELIEFDAEHSRILYETVQSMRRKQDALERYHVLELALLKSIYSIVENDAINGTCKENLRVEAFRYRLAVDDDNDDFYSFDWNDITDLVIDSKDPLNENEMSGLIECLWGGMMTSLKTVEMRGNWHHSRQLLSGLTKCCNLDTLIVSESDLCDSEYFGEATSRMDSLNHLIIRKCDLTEKSAKMIGRMKELTRLDVEDCKIGADSLTSIG